MNSKNILVLGAGVSGMTTALKLLQAGRQVTVWSKEPAGQFPSTSLNAYAMWVPVKIDADPRIERWTNEGFDAFAALADDTATGVVMRRIFQLKTERNEPWFAGSFSGFRHAEAHEISDQYADAHVLDRAPVIDPVVYLQWLREQVLSLGVLFQTREVRSFSECPEEFDVIVNCTGLGARKLANDEKVFPDRIQVVTIRATGLADVFIDDEGPNQRACAVPHGDYIKLGAVFDGKHESTEVDDALTADILALCNRMVPGLNARLDDVLSVVRALRPEREGWLPRVENESLSDGRTVIHNYGHDGMGYILSYGIAKDIAKAVAEL